MSGAERCGSVGIEVLEQACSRICHDLAGPIGAIRNGLELIADAEEGGADAGGDQALELIGHSAGHAAKRLRLFRLAYGRATSEGVRSFTELRDTAADWLSGGRVTLKWPAGDPEDDLASRPGVAKTALNLVMLASDAIPQGGTVAVSGGGDAESGFIAVAAAGRGVKWPPELAVALSGRLAADALGPRTIHAVVTGRFADHYGLTLTWDSPDAETLNLRLSW
ncbi:MAG: histidine phosphotransferase family protein [Rhodospirillaceae bacterium]